MKRPSFHDYHQDDTVRTEAALLTVWPKLADIHEDLVLVGGLVPRYLCRPMQDEWQPHTLDVDFAIALAAGGGMYEPLSQRLVSDGFEQKKGGRFEKVIARNIVYVDFLTERPSAGSASSALVDDVPVSALYGVDRALKVYREVSIEGRDLNGTHVRETVKVCEAGPFLCLKLQAYARRAERKDVFDVVHTVLTYGAGPDAAVAAFRAEEGVNLAFPISSQILAERFADEVSKGPVDYATFCLSAVEAAGGEDLEFRRSLLAADAVTVARKLWEK